MKKINNKQRIIVFTGISNRFPEENDWPADSGYLLTQAAVTFILDPGRKPGW